jgi:uncharacterized protein (DUF305 family)
MKSKLTALTLLVVTTAACAEMNMSGGSGDFMTGMAKMDHDMAAAPMTGNVDHDFASMMIPHHQGAIDMAEVELKSGHDPEMRRLAEDIIKAQKIEIAQMHTWLKSDAAAAK